WQPSASPLPVGTALLALKPGQRHVAHPAPALRRSRPSAGRASASLSRTAPGGPKFWHRVPRRGAAEATEGLPAPRRPRPWPSRAGRRRRSAWGLPVVTRRTIPSAGRSDRLPLAPGRRCDRFLLPADEFGPQDADLLGGVDTEPHPVPSDLDHGEGDAVAD